MRFEEYGRVPRMQPNSHGSVGASDCCCVYSVYRESTNQDPSHGVHDLRIGTFLKAQSS